MKIKQKETNPPLGPDGPANSQPADRPSRPGPPPFPVPPTRVGTGARSRPTTSPAPTPGRIRPPRPRLLDPASHSPPLSPWFLRLSHSPPDPPLPRLTERRRRHGCAIAAATGHPAPRQHVHETRRRPLPRLRLAIELEEHRTVGIELVPIFSVAGDRRRLRPPLRC